MAGDLRFARPVSLSASVAAALRPVRAGGGRLRRRRGLSRLLRPLPGHPRFRAEHAGHRCRDVEIGVETRPVQVEPHAVDLNLREVRIVRAVQLLGHLGREDVGAAVRQLDHHTARLRIVAGGRGAGIGPHPLLAAPCGGLKLLVSQLDHGWAPIRPRTRRSVPPPPILYEAGSFSLVAAFLYF